MRVVTFTGKQGLKSLGAFTDKGVVDLKASAERAGASAGSFQNMAAFLEAGEMARIAADRLANDKAQAQIVALEEVRLGAPVPRPGKIIAVGLNYRDHSMESGAMEPPKIAADLREIHQQHLRSGRCNCAASGRRKSGL